MTSAVLISLLNQGGADARVLRRVTNSPRSLHQRALFHMREALLRGTRVSKTRHILEYPTRRLERWLFNEFAKQKFQWEA